MNDYAENPILRFPDTGEEVSLYKQRMTIGRSASCDVAVMQPEISRKHAEIFEENGEWYITDCNSSNGVTVGGRRLQPGQKYRLTDGCDFCLAERVDVRFVAPEEEEGTVMLGQDEDEGTTILMADDEDYGRTPSYGGSSSYGGASDSRQSASNSWGAGSASLDKSSNVGGYTPMDYMNNYNSSANVNFAEYVDSYAPTTYKKKVKGAAIGLYICSGLTFVFSIAVQNYLGLLYVAAVLTLAIIMHMKKSVGCAIALVCATAFDVILGVALTGSFSGWMPLVFSIFALVALTKAKKEYQASPQSRKNF